MKNRRTYMFANVTATSPNDPREYEVQSVHKDMMVLQCEDGIILLQDEDLMEEFLMHVKQDQEVVYQRVTDQQAIQALDTMRQELPISTVHALQTYVTPMERKKDDER